MLKPPSKQSALDSKLIIKQRNVSTTSRTRRYAQTTLICFEGFMIAKRILQLFVETSDFLVLILPCKMPSISGTIFSKGHRCWISDFELSLAAEGKG